MRPPDARLDRLVGTGAAVFRASFDPHGNDYEGCGIGLAVCRKIVDAHGGAIAAAPAPGAGRTPDARP